VEELRAKLCESEQVCEQLRKESARIKRLSQSHHQFAAGTPIKNGFSKSAAAGGGSVSSPWASTTGPPGMIDMYAEDADSGYSVQELIDMAKKDLEKNKEEKRRKASVRSSAANAANASGTVAAVATTGNGEKDNKMTDEDKDANSADDEDDGSEEEEDDDEDVEDEDELEDDLDEDDSEEDTDTEESDNKAHEEFNEELVELTSEISLKQKLIEELEMSQKRLHTMKHQYETKLIALQERINATQEERDKVLKNLHNNPKSAVEPEKLTKIKHDYQR